MGNAEVHKGDILYIPSYWWHHVHNNGRTIAVTSWFDYFSKQAMAGTGMGLPSDYMGRKIKYFKQNYGAMRRCDKSNPSAMAKLSDFRGCSKTLDLEGNWDHAAKRPLKCNELEPLDGFRANKDLVKKFTDKHLQLQQMLADFRPQFGNIDHNLEDLHSNFSRTDIRIAFANMSGPCDAHLCDWNNFVDGVGSGLYWKNRFWMRRLRTALGEDRLDAFLEGFNLEESFRALYDLRVQHEATARSADGAAAAESERLVGRIDALLAGRKAAAFPLHHPTEEELTSNVFSSLKEEQLPPIEDVPPLEDVPPPEGEPLPEDAPFPEDAPLPEDAPAGGGAAGKDDL